MHNNDGLRIWPQIHAFFIQKSSISPISVYQKFDDEWGWVSIRAWASIWMNTAHPYLYNLFTLRKPHSSLRASFPKVNRLPYGGYNPGICSDEGVSRAVGALVNTHIYECICIASPPWLFHFPLSSRYWLASKPSTRAAYCHNLLVNIARLANVCVHSRFHPTSVGYNLELTLTYPALDIAELLPWQPGICQVYP